MAMTSLIRWATEATASLPSIVTMRLFDMLPPDAECARLGSPDAATANRAGRAEMPVHECKGRARLELGQTRGPRGPDITRSSAPDRIDGERLIDAGRDRPTKRTFRNDELFSAGCVEVPLGAQPAIGNRGASAHSP